jgi:hypothetical protein
MKLALIVIGVALEIVGLGLTAWPELSPRAQRVVGGVRRLLTRAENRLRRWIGRPRSITVLGGMAGSVAVSGRASLVHSISDEADVEAKLRFLIDEARRNQERFDTLEHRITDAVAEWRTQLDQVRAGSLPLCSLL